MSREIFSPKEDETTHIAMFLHFDRDDRKFLFQLILSKDDPLHGAPTIPAGKLEYEDENTHPRWILDREQLEEQGIMWKGIGGLFRIHNPETNTTYCPYLTYGVLRGELRNEEPEKAELVWLRWDEIFDEFGGNQVTIRSVIKNEMARHILLDARELINKHDL